VVLRINEEHKTQRVVRESASIPIAKCFYFPADKTFSSRAKHELARCFQESAPKLCKPSQDTEQRVVSLPGSELFHKLFNTCVENFTKQKHLEEDSARVLLAVIELRTRLYE
jgi:hypothetical protein